jgi:hypothetical protein
MDSLTVSIWQAIIATAGGVTLAVVIPILIAFWAIRPWINNAIKAGLSEFRVKIEKDLEEIKTRIEKASISEREAENQAYIGLKDKPNPPITRKNELLDKWHNQTMSYPESIELKTILEQESKDGDDAKKALIVIAIIGIGLYLLTHKTEG